MVGHFRAVPGEHTAQYVRPTFWHHTFGTTADDIASESGGGGISGAPAVRSVSERWSPEGVAATRGRSVGWPKPRWPTLSTLQAQSVLSGLRGWRVGVVATADAREATAAGGIATAPLAPARRGGAVPGGRGRGRPGGRVGADRPGT